MVRESTLVLILKELFGALTRRAKAVEITMLLLKEGVGLMAR